MADPEHIVLKMITGYNVGLHVDGIQDIQIHGRKVANYKIPEKDFPFTDGQPRVKLFGTGAPSPPGWTTAPAP